VKANLPGQVTPELKAKNGGSMPPFFMVNSTEHFVASQ
jgi:hypothetical protein